MPDNPEKMIGSPENWIRLCAAVTTQRGAHLEKAPMPRLKPRELISVTKSADIRFLTVVSTLTRGGTERAAMNYALGYRRADYPSAVLAYNGGGPRRTQLENEGVLVFEGGPDEAGTRRAVDEARAWNPDIIHLNRPGETDSVSGTVLKALVHPRLRVFETNVFSRADQSDDRVLIDLHLHLSRWCLWKWTLAASGLSPKSPGIVVPYSVDCQAFGPLSSDQRPAIRKSFGIPEGAVVYGRVGQPSEGKWSPSLISAFEAVADRLPDAWLAICGLPDRLKAMLADLPQAIRARVLELPITDDDAELRRYYALIDIFVHSSEKGESFGLVLCEAMLSGLPVITMSTPLRDNSQIEVVPHNEAGIVVQTLLQMIQAMFRLHEDSAFYEYARRQAPIWVRNNYDISIVTRKLLDIAPVALAATSSQDLIRRLASLPGTIEAVSAGKYRDLLSDVEIKQSWRDSLLTSLVNRPGSRRAIGLVRSSSARIRQATRAS
jgi:Glycosyl transferases group 1